MGATVHTNCKVFALPTVPDLEQQYLLEEETYEKNCYPHHPHWSVHYIGSYRECMKEIVQWSTSVESGGLQIKGGGTPNSYIKRWRKAFSVAMEVYEQTFIEEPFFTEIRFGQGIYEIPTTSKEIVVEVLRKYKVDISSADVEGNSSSLKLDLTKSTVQLAIRELAHLSRYNGCHAWIFFRSRYGNLVGNEKNNVKILISNI